MFHDGYRDGYEDGRRQAQAGSPRDSMPPVFKIMKYGASYVDSFARGVEQAFRDADQEPRTPNNDRKGPDR